MEAEVTTEQFQFTDERVTRIKFERQVENFEKFESEYRKEGIIALDIEFPYFEFVFFGKETLIHIPTRTPGQALAFRRPVPLYLFSVKIDYTNFDTIPPSIKIINPLTNETVQNVGYSPIITPDQQNKNSLIDERFKKINQNILLQDNKNELFFCLRGLKEYHEHPQHNGDSWFLYRLNGKGDILAILDQLQLYTITNYNKMLSQQLRFDFNNG